MWERPPGFPRRPNGRGRRAACVRAAALRVGAGAALAAPGDVFGGRGGSCGGGDEEQQGE